MPLWREAERLGAMFNFYILPHQMPMLEDMAGRFSGVKVVVDHAQSFPYRNPIRSSCRVHHSSPPDGGERAGRGEGTGRVEAQAKAGKLGSGVVGGELHHAADPGSCRVGVIYQESRVRVGSHHE